MLFSFEFSYSRRTSFQFNWGISTCMEFPYDFHTHTYSFDFSIFLFSSVFYSNGHSICPLSTQTIPRHSIIKYTSTQHKHTHTHTRPQWNPNFAYAGLLSGKVSLSNAVSHPTHLPHFDIVLINFIYFIDGHTHTRVPQLMFLRSIAVIICLKIIRNLLMDKQSDTFNTRELVYRLFLWGT